MMDPEFWKVIAGGGAAVAVLVVVLLFLRYFAAVIKQIADDFTTAQVASQKAYQDQVDRLADQIAEGQKAFQDQMQRVSDNHLLLTREAVAAIKCVEKTVDGSTGTIRQVEKRLEDLSVAVRSLETLVNPRPRPPG